MRFSDAANAREPLLLLRLWLDAARWALGRPGKYLRAQALTSCEASSLAALLWMEAAEARASLRVASTLVLTLMATAQEDFCVCAFGAGAALAWSTIQSSRSRSRSNNNKVLDLDSHKWVLLCTSSGLFSSHRNMHEIASRNLVQRQQCHSQ